MKKKDRKTERKEKNRKVAARQRKKNDLYKKEKIKK